MSVKRSLLLWLGAVLPLALLAGLLAVFAWTGAGSLVPSAAPVEEISFERVLLRDGEIHMTLRNTGPQEVTIAQVIVDDAVWDAYYDPSPTIDRLGKTQVRLYYPWVEGERHEIKLITTNSLIFAHEIPVATASPVMDATSLWAFGLIGLYVGVIPVGLGLLWFPFLRRAGQGVVTFVLALTVGLLAFLLVDTVAEGLEMAAELPGVLKGIPLLLLGGVLAYAVLTATGEKEANRRTGSDRLRLAYLIALGIGLHNLGEGLAIGSAFAVGESSLGIFLIIGFTLHNITEGVGIAAPVLRDQPALRHFIKLAVLAGGPAIAGTWIGAFVQSPLLTVLFFGLGAGAIAQVIVEVGRLLLQERSRAQNWLNVGGFAAGVLVMYLTALLVP